MARGADPLQVHAIPDKAKPLPEPKGGAIVPVVAAGVGVAAPVLEPAVDNALEDVVEAEVFPSPLRQLQSG